jgi:hypothetical protein
MYRHLECFAGLIDRWGPAYFKIPGVVDGWQVICTDVVIGSCFDHNTFAPLGDTSFGKDDVHIVEVSDT